MDRNIQDRVKVAVDVICGGNKSEFCRRIGRNAFAIKDTIGGKGTAPSYDLIYDILSSDLGISPTWLMLGEGDMLKPKGESVHGQTNLSLVGTAQSVFIANWMDMEPIVEKVFAKVMGGK